MRKERKERLEQLRRKLVEYVQGSIDLQDTDSRSADVAWQNAQATRDEIRRALAEPDSPEHIRALRSYLTDLRLLRLNDAARDIDSCIMSSCLERAQRDYDIAEALATVWSAATEKSAYLKEMHSPEWRAARVTLLAPIGAEPAMSVYVDVDVLGRGAWGDSPGEAICALATQINEKGT